MEKLNIASIILSALTSNNYSKDDVKCAFVSTSDDLIKMREGDLVDVFLDESDYYTLRCCINYGVVWLNDGSWLEWKVVTFDGKHGWKYCSSPKLPDFLK